MKIYSHTTTTPLLVHSQYVSLLELQWRVRNVLIHIIIVWISCIEDTVAYFSIVIHSTIVSPPYLDLSSERISNCSSHYPLCEVTTASEVDVRKYSLMKSQLIIKNVHIICFILQRFITEKSICT